jgi:hypothetical protein
MAAVTNGRGARAKALVVARLRSQLTVCTENKNSGRYAKVPDFIGSGGAKISIPPA